MKHQFTVLIEQGEDGAYIATVPALKGCHTQADTVPGVLAAVREAIELCLEAQQDILPLPKFIGIQQMEIAI